MTAPGLRDRGVGLLPGVDVVLLLAGGEQSICWWGDWQMDIVVMGPFLDSEFPSLRGSPCQGLSRSREC